MVNKTQYIEIGYTKKVHGLSGEIKAFVNERYLEDFVSAKSIFIELNGSPVPYFPQNIRLGNEIIMKLEDVSEMASARLLQSKKIFLDEKYILAPGDRKIAIKGEEYIDLDNFEMQTPEGIVLGIIVETVDMPGQKMAVLQVGEEEKMIPLNEYFVKEIVRDKKQVIVDLPEGLLDL